jgi:hypothetical protein
MGEKSQRMAARLEEVNGPPETVSEENREFRNLCVKRMSRELTNGTWN